MPSTPSPIVDAPVAVPIADAVMPRRTSAPVVEAVAASFAAPIVVPSPEPELLPVKDAPTVDIDLSGLVSGPIAAPEISRGSAFLRWSAALVLMGGMIATAFYVGNWPEAAERTRPAAAPAPAPGSEGPQPITGPVAIPQETVAEESMRRPRRHRRSLREGAAAAAAAEAADKEDTDGTLPLSEDEPAQ